ncbi:hypothetical protein [Moorena sp. SIO1F2]|nr:hypothetical protein [Moorena sp. SIO1F2]
MGYIMFAIAYPICAIAQSPMAGFKLTSIKYGDVFLVQVVLN